MIFGYIGALFTGLILGLLGGGGALLSIPVLVYLFHIDAATATGYSLFLVGATALIGAVQNFRKNLIDFKVAFYYGISSLVAVYTVRRYVIPALPDVIFSIGDFTLDKNHLILFVLSTVMFIAGFKMIAGSEKEVKSDGGEVDYIRLPLYAFPVGAFLGLVGAGGGFLMTPALMIFGKLDMKKAVGTSLLLVSVNSFIGFLGDIRSNQTIDWLFLGKFSAFSIIGVLLGMYLSRFISSKSLKKYFGWFIVLVGVLIVVRELIGAGSAN